ncbi:uncharacterized protein LOC129322427 [Prosopis cineraria]|uniref:uncharacterized protein LOC129322427 n=1 Tax=Prosopis cineraria TaxID=364024 RepID=UPI00240F9C8D|nr:uncharacterized protein LOC129322427 [Prosopis cineraria]
MFHISLLKCYHGEVPDVYLPLPLTTTTECPILQSTAVLTVRHIQNGRIWVCQVLIQWDGSLDSTWEDASVIASNYPVFDLNDKMKGERKANISSYAKFVEEFYKKNKGKYKSIGEGQGDLTKAYDKLSPAKKEEYSKKAKEERGETVAKYIVPFHTHCSPSQFSEWTCGSNNSIKGRQLKGIMLEDASIFSCQEEAPKLDDALAYWDEEKVVERVKVEKKSIRGILHDPMSTYGSSSTKSYPTCAFSHSDLETIDKTKREGDDIEEQAHKDSEEKDEEEEEEDDEDNSEEADEDKEGEGKNKEVDEDEESEGKDEEADKKSSEEGEEGDEQGVEENVELGEEKDEEKSERDGDEGEEKEAKEKREETICVHESMDEGGEEVKGEVGKLSTYEDEVKEKEAAEGIRQLQIVEVREHRRSQRTFMQMYANFLTRTELQCLGGTRWISDRFMTMVTRTLVGDHKENEGKVRRHIFGSEFMEKMYKRRKKKDKNIKKGEKLVGKKRDKTGQADVKEKLAQACSWDNTYLDDNGYVMSEYSDDDLRHMKVKLL